MLTTEQIWKSTKVEFALREPVTYHEERQRYTIRLLRKGRERLMVRLETASDNVMRPLELMPWNTQKLILERL